MFVNFNLKSIENGDIRVKTENANQDLKHVIECFKKEGFKLSKWSLFEIASTGKERVYGFEDTDDHYVYMLIGENDLVTPNYFKNHDLNQYSLFQAESIGEAIRLYDAMYSPII